MKSKNQYDQLALFNSEQMQQMVQPLGDEWEALLQATKTATFSENDSINETTIHFKTRRKGKKKKL